MKSSSLLYLAREEGKRKSACDATCCVLSILKRYMNGLGLVLADTQQHAMGRENFKGVV